MNTKKILPLFMLLLLAAYSYTADAATAKAKHKKSAKTTRSKSKKKQTVEYTGPLLRIADAKNERPALAGFNTTGHYKLTVVQTVTPAIRISGSVQPRVHICVEGQPQKGSCIEELGNGYGNMHWEAKANTKCYMAAYKPDGTKIPIKKELLNTKRPWRGNEFVWEDDQYKVRVKVSKCRVMPNGVAICD